MQLIKYTNKTFMAKFDRYEPLLQDHTQMDAYKQCQRLYFYRMVLGFVPREDPYQTVLDFGQAYHTFRDRLQVTGDLKVAMQAALSIKITPAPPSPPAAAKFAFMTQERLMQSMALAYQHWETDQQQKKIKVISVEQPINVQMPDGSFIAGRPDQIVEWNGEIWDLDYKTTSKDKSIFVSSTDPNDQFTRYIYMLGKLHGRKIGGVILDVLFNAPEPKKISEKSKFGPEIYRHLVTRTQSQLDQWEKEQMLINKQLELNRQHDLWPMAENKMKCQWCKYKFVCQGMNEQQQMSRLESGFKKQPWNHLAVGQKVIDV